MTQDAEQPLLIPYQDLPAGTLRAIAEDFCTRDGTDYGAQELSLEQKVSLLMRQLARGEAHIVFEGRSQSLSILTEDERRKRGL